jgi:hypothetical protein
MATCKKCGTENPVDSNYCIICGTPIEQQATVKCPNGHIYDSHLERCPYCPSSDLQEMMGYGKTISSEAVNTMSVDNSGATKLIPETDNVREPQFKGNKTVIVNEGNSTGTSRRGRKLAGWLVSFTWDKNGEDFKLFEGRNMVSGSPGADIVLNDPAISSPHCLILFREGKFKIKDQLSTNGTKINGDSIEEGELKDGDMLKLGRTEFKFKAL